MRKKQFRIIKSSLCFFLFALRLALFCSLFSLTGFGSVLTLLPSLIASPVADCVYEYVRRRVCIATPAVSLNHCRKPSYSAQLETTHNHTDTYTPTHTNTHSCTDTDINVQWSSWLVCSMCDHELNYFYSATLAVGMLQSTGCRLLSNRYSGIS